MTYRRTILTIAFSTVIVSSTMACSNKSSDSAPGTQAGSSNGSSGSGNGTGGGSVPTSGGVPNGPRSPYDSGMVPVGQLEPAPSTKLPELPRLTNVYAMQADDSAAIGFDPFDDARDYRVYPLPADGKIKVGSDGAVVVEDAIYRCAGDREAPPTYKDSEPMLGGAAIHAQVDQQNIGGYMRTLANATLGYVYIEPGEGRVPVYVLGESDKNADSTCFFARWAASRVKKYTTSTSERDQLLKDRARDDGIAFYVPAEASAETTTVYSGEKDTNTPFFTRYYFPGGAEADAHGMKEPAFQVLTAAAPGTAPLMRVFYGNNCGWSHDELAVGKERFNRVYHQGDKLPAFSLVWSGITEQTTLVVEALDSGCPHQAYLSPMAFPTSTVRFGDIDIVHQPWLTLDDIRAAAPTKEVFVNGQHEATNLPKAIARSFISVKPTPHPKMDFFADFSAKGTPETFAPKDCAPNCYQTWRQDSPTFEQEFINAEVSPDKTSGLFAYGQMLGEWWISYADVGADTNGKYRLTAKQKAEMSDSKFLHVTMEVDSYATARRYPQILISDADAPVQYGLKNGHTIIVQPRAEINTEIDFPVNYEIQLCKLRTWDVNDQCPVYDLHHGRDASGEVTHLAPNDELGEVAAADRRVLFDVYTSSKRTYLFLDGKPYACADLTAGAAPTGPVTVTWGDALYHSAVDHTFAFHSAHMLVEQRRHFDNLGFSSGLDAPTWDESRLPCAAPIAL